MTAHLISVVHSLYTRANDAKGTRMRTVSRAVGALTGQRASRPDRRTYLTASISLAGLATFVIGVLVLHLLKSDVNPARHTISEYVLGDFGWIQTIDFLAGGIGAFALALTLRRSVSDPGRIAPVLIGVWGVCAASLALFPTDVTPEPTTTTGWAHGIIALTGFALLIAGMFVIARRFGGDPAWSTLRRPTIVWAWTASATFFLIPILGPSGQGIGQRIFVTVLFSWMLAVAYRARDLARSA